MTPALIDAGAAALAPVPPPNVGNCLDVIAHASLFARVFVDGVSKVMCTYVGT